LPTPQLLVFYSVPLLTALPALFVFFSSIPLQNLIIGFLSVLFLKFFFKGVLVPSLNRVSSCRTQRSLILHNQMLEFHTDRDLFMTFSKALSCRLLSSRLTRCFAHLCPIEKLPLRISHQVLFPRIMVVPLFFSTRF